ncbi:hypothetical protein Asphe3_09010 [Pseudarthrobacter phenanthrenivorans Sphe3]|uniref:Biotin synthase auxiliary protein n=1 Tax=Pseudarthrobacter phenanthrenivorans (strain DSM 18606 / JCM 16027 / LMG 23796 / Sphe3) TaxID=930171 RepID=F0M2E1_PSEPM|nr:hypothetical protein Asphe3_09010 [Pseudarthrobacter phenanthrenivorans Sphe3]
MIPNRSIADAFCGLCGDPQEGEPQEGDPQEKETSDGGTPPPWNVRQAGGTSGDIDAHGACRARLQLEPPRYCPQCGRRLKVQVTPHSWQASCSRHGATRS